MSRALTRRRVLGLLLAAFLGPGRTLAQQPTAEVPAALEARLPGLQGEERARVLVQLVEAYEDENPKRAAELGEKALKVFAAHPDPAREALLLTDLAWALTKLGQYDQAVAYGEEARALAERNGDRLQASLALRNIGTLEQRRGDPMKAIEYFEKALDLRRQLGLPNRVAGTLQNLGDLQLEQGDHQGALRSHSETLKIRETLGEFPFSPAAPEALRWEQVVDIADYAAYVAKQSGRNRCVGLSVAPEGLPPEAPVRATLEEWTREGRLCVEAAPA